MRKLILLLLLLATPVSAQTYTQLQWGLDKTATPYAFGANIGGTWRNLGTVSSGGVWSIPSSNLGFTQSGAGAVATTVDAKLKQIVNVEDFGADPTGATDSATAFLNAYNAVVARGGGVINVGPGLFKLSSLPTISASAVTLQCSGEIPTTLAQSADSGDFLTITGQRSGVKNCGFWPAIRLTSGFAIKIGNGCLDCFVYDIAIRYHNSGVYVLSASNTLINRLSIRNTTGGYGLYYAGTLANGAYGVTINSMSSDNPYPLGDASGPSGYKTWTTSTAYSLKDVVYVNGNIYQCVTAGTSASGGSGPSGFPSGTSPASIFSGTITDGTAQWKFVSATLTGIVWDSYAYSLRINNSLILDHYRGMLINDAANTGTSFPYFGHFNDIEVDHNYADGILVANGSDIEIVNSWIGSTLKGAGLNIGSGFTSSLTVSNTRITGNYSYGVAVGGGVKTIFSSNFVTANSWGSAGSFDGIYVAANVGNFVVNGNQFGKNMFGTAGQRYGVYVAAGTSDYYNIVNNICSGEQSSGCISDGGSGANKTVSGNH